MKHLKSRKTDVLGTLSILGENAEGGEVLPGESRMQIDYTFAFVS
jgi:hypothetical protein